MFERFTDKARGVTINASEVAKRRGYKSIDVLHLEQALLHIDSKMPYLIFEELEVSLDDARLRATARLPQVDVVRSGHVPFTADAKKSLELALREALQLGHNYIGTEHLFLGLMRMEETIGSGLFLNLGFTMSGLRQAVIRVLIGIQRTGKGVETVPYVAPKRAEELTKEPLSEGDLTFLLQQAIQRYLLSQLPLDYAAIARVLGALEGAKADFIRRIVNPYEAKKQRENGDVWDSKILDELQEPF